MKTLKDIQDEVANESHGKYSEDAGWSDFTEEAQFKLWPEVCRRAQLECARETLKEASGKALVHGKHPTNEVTQKKIYTHHPGWEIEVDKSSITDEGNIKLVA